VRPVSPHRWPSRGVVSAQARFPVVAAVEMGLGHLRAADALARGFGASIAHADRAPLASPAEQRLWRRTRRFYERVSRVSQLPVVVNMQCWRGERACATIDADGNVTFSN